MKILIVSEMSIPYVVGGGEVRYGLLVRELARRGHQVRWLSMRQRQSPTEETIDGVNHLHRGPRIAAPPVRSAVSMARFMFSAFFHVLANRYDVIDAQTYAPLPPIWLACLLSRQRMVATIHDVSRGDKGQWMTDRFRRLVGFAESFLYRLPYRRIIAVSESTANALEVRWGVSPQRIRTIPNGIEVPEVRAEDPRDIDLIFAGRFVPTKNIGELLDIVRRCRDSGAVRRVVLVGDGPLLPAMIERARTLGLSDVIEFTGRKSNAEVLALLRRAKVFFHASSREGFPVVMVEALACNLPVVAYRVPGVVDVVSVETGILVTEHDIEAHARGCIELLRSDERRAEMAAAGRRAVVESLTLSKMTDRILDVYRQMQPATRANQDSKSA